jgi:hypothetical protein
MNANRRKYLQVQISEYGSVSTTDARKLLAAETVMNFASIRVHVWLKPERFPYCAG